MFSCYLGVGVLVFNLAGALFLFFFGALLLLFSLGFFYLHHLLLYATQTSTFSMSSFVIPIFSFFSCLQGFFRLKNLFGVSLLWLELAHPAAIFTLVFNYSK